MSLRNNGSPRLGRKILKGLRQSKEYIMEGMHGMQQSSGFSKDSRNSLRHRKEQSSTVSSSNKKSHSDAAAAAGLNSQQRVIRNVSSGELESMRGLSSVASHESTVRDEGKAAALEQNNRYVKRKLSTITSSKEEEDSKDSKDSKECEDVPLLVDFGQGQPLAAGNRLTPKKWHSWGQIGEISYNGESGHCGLSLESRNNSSSLLDKCKATSMSANSHDSSLKQRISDLLKSGQLEPSNRGHGAGASGGERGQDEGQWPHVSSDCEKYGASAVESRV